MGGSAGRRRRLRRRHARMSALAAAAGACDPSSSPLALKDGGGHGAAHTSALPRDGGVMAAAGGCDCASLADRAADGGGDGVHGEEDGDAPWVPAMCEQVDAMDLSGKWQEGVVVGLLDEENHVYRVHFRGWGSHWDESIELESGRLRPAYTVLRRWRDRLRVGDSVEIRHPQNPQQWIWAQVEEVDAENGRMRCGEGTEWISVYGEDITAPNTHFSQSFGEGSGRLRDACGQIIEPGIEPHDTDIHRRAMLGDESGMRVLLKDEPECVNAVGRDRMTPLLLAAAHHRAEVLDVLVEAGADVGAVSRTARGPLHLAIFHRSHPLPTLPVVAKLLSYGCDPNTQDLRLATPLTMAAENQPEVGELLVKLGADVGLTDMGGSTALHMACFAGHVGLVRTLLRAGADPLAVDAYGQRPEDVACLKRTVLRPLKGCIVDVLHDAIRCIGVKSARRVRDRLKARLQGPVPSSESKSVDVCDMRSAETLLMHAAAGGAVEGVLTRLSSAVVCAAAAAAAPVPAGRIPSSSAAATSSSPPPPPRSSLPSSSSSSSSPPPPPPSAAAATVSPQPSSPSSPPESSPPPPPSPSAPHTPPPPAPSAHTASHTHHNSTVTTTNIQISSITPQRADSGYSAGGGGGRGSVGACCGTGNTIGSARAGDIHSYSSSSSRVATAAAERWGGGGGGGLAAATAACTAAAPAAAGGGERGGEGGRRSSVARDDGHNARCSTSATTGCAPSTSSPTTSHHTAAATSTPFAPPVLQHVIHAMPHDMYTELVDYFLAP